MLNLTAKSLECISKSKSKFMKVSNLSILMVKKVLSIGLSINFLLLSLMSEMAFAYETASHNSYENLPTIGDIAETMISGTDFVTRIALAAAIIMGAGFILFSITSYRQHRMNPKLVPLDRPVLYLVIGICLCFLPYLGKFVGETQSTIDLKKKKAIAIYTYTDIDAPLR